MEKRLMTAAVLALATAVATLGGPAAAHAAAVGVYGSVGAGTADWDENTFAGFDNTRDRRDTRHGGAGLVLDAAAPFAPIGYRLNVGWERITHERRFDVARLELEGIVVDQDLTLQLIGPGPLRLWVGPELRLGFFDGSWDGGGDEDFLAIGIGPVFGADFRVSPGMAVSWKVGYLYTSYAGRGNDAAIDDSSLGEGHVYANLALMFSPWGHYERPAPPRAVPQRPYEPQAPGYPPPGYNPRRW